MGKCSIQLDTDAIECVCVCVLVGGGRGFICIHHVLLSFTFHKNGTSGNKASWGTLCLCVCVCERERERERKIHLIQECLKAWNKTPFCVICHLAVWDLCRASSFLTFPEKCGWWRSRHFFETCSLKRASVKLKESREFNKDALKKVFYRKLLHCYSLIKINFSLPS